MHHIQLPNPLPDVNLWGSSEWWNLIAIKKTLKREKYQLCAWLSLNICNYITSCFPQHSLFSASKLNLIHLSPLHIGKYKPQLSFGSGVFPYDCVDCQIGFTVNQPSNPLECTHPQRLGEARRFKSSRSLGKYEQGKWRRNTCFPENHQDALEQSIYPSIYPQTAPLEVVSGQR